MSAVECFCHGSFINQCTAGSVEEDESRACFGEQFGTDHASVVGTQRAMQTDDVGGGKGFLERHFPHSIRQFALRTRSDGAENKSERFHDCSHGTSDVAHAHDAKFSAREFKARAHGIAEVRTGSPASGAGAAEGFIDAIGKTKQQRERELCDTQCGVVLAVTNGDAVGTGGAMGMPGCTARKK